MDITTDAPALREALQIDPKRGITQLTELASRHANDRGLVYRAVLLKRRLSRLDAPPSPEQLAEGQSILDALIADQASAVAAGRPTRQAALADARARAMAIDVPRDVVLACEQLGVSYRRGGFTLRNVSFQIRFGEIVGIVGRNGNGKTTLFRLIVGELDPNAGRLRFPAILPGDGRLRWSAIRRQIAYVPQDLPPWYGSLRSNLHYEAATHGIPRADNRQEVDYIIERLGLAEQLDKRWSELSGGFRLRFALARALVWKPRLLVLDEPLANLDFIAQQTVLDDLRHLTESLRYPLAVLISSQHIHEIEEVSDKLLVLADGDMRFFGGIAEIGAERTFNRFELAGHGITLSDLESVFSGSDYYSVSYTGVAFVLTGSRRVTTETVLERLAGSGLPITYFRDISRSTKSVLQDDAAD